MQMDKATALSQLMFCPKPTITADEAAKVLGCKPDTLRKQIQTDSSKLGFPVSFIGNRIHIPREPFIKYLKGN